MSLKTVFTIFSLVLTEYGSCDELIEKHPCNSEIYCYGDLLHTVQTLRIFSDGKTFVDLRLKYPPATVLQNFENLKTREPQLDWNTVKTFVDENTLNCTVPENKCQDLIKWDPPDWTPEPFILKRIYDTNFRDWAKQLNNLWKELGRKVSNQVKENPEMSSLIYVPNGFIVPGGRFRELYYWDTYWIIKGLLICEMPTTVKGIIENFISLIKEFGHIPNGGRIYYTHRTQPPMLLSMVHAYLKATNDRSIITDNIEWLEKEIEFFIKNRRITVEKNGFEYQLFRYFAPSNGPRPESYIEDYNLAVSLPSDEEKEKLYLNLKSAAESGWDFSSRWFIKNGTENGNLYDTNVVNIIPVDLNALMHKNFRLLSRWYQDIVPNVEKAEHYKGLAIELLNSIDNILWNNEEGIWLDYDLINCKPRNNFYMSNFSPLWTKSYKFKFNRRKLASKIIDYVNRHGLFSFIGGSPTSLVYSNEQWDFPNAWAPMQAFLIQGLDQIGTPKSSQIAYHLANTWIQSNYGGFRKFAKMFEKYNSLSFGESGTGGEYEGQAGFGWTNGLVFDFLDRWGSDFITPRTAKFLGNKKMTDSFEVLEVKDNS